MKIGYCTGSCDQGRKQCNCSTAGSTVEISDNVVVAIAAAFIIACCVFAYLR